MASSDPASQSVTQPLDRRLPTAPPRGNLRQLVRDPLGFFHSAASQYGDIVCYRSAPEPANFINHPDYVRHVLLDNNHNYHKVTSSNLLFTIVVGEGLLTSEGETWRKQRRMMQPAFHHTRLERLGGRIAQAAGSML